MKEISKFNNFDLNLLEEIVCDENSLVSVCTLQHHVALHPFQLNDLKKSVNGLLNREIAKYNAKLGGIVFGYKNVKFLSSLGRICDDSCFIHVDIEADFFIFKPEEGKTLQGVVNKQTKDHIGCLVHKFFNISIPKPKRSDDWIGNSVVLGSEVSFTITQTNFEEHLPYIKGKIESIISSPENYDVPEDEINEDKNKVNKKIIFEDNAEDDVQEAISNTKRKKKKFSSEQKDEEIVVAVKRKKNKSKTIVDEDELGEYTVREEEQVDKKSRKRKRSTTSEINNLDIADGNIDEDMPIIKKRRKGTKSFTEVNGLESYDNIKEEIVEDDKSISKKSRKRKKSFVETSDNGTEKIN